MRKRGRQGRVYIRVRRCWLRSDQFGPNGWFFLLSKRTTFGFLMEAEHGCDQHGNGHCGGEHENHHGCILLSQSTAARANWLRAADHERFTWQP